MVYHCFLFLPVLSGILWGTAGIFVRSCLDLGMDNVTILASKIVPATLVFGLGIFFYDRSLLRVSLRDLWIFACAGVIGMLGLNLCYNEAIDQLTLSLAAVLLALAPVFVIVLASFLFQERITARKVVCVILAVLGCVLVSGVLEEGSGLRWTFQGISIGVTSAFFYALYSIFAKIAMNREYRSLTILFYAFAVTALLLLPVTDWSIMGSLFVRDPGPYATLLFLQLLCTSVLPYIMFTLALTVVPSGTAAILASDEPVAAMVMGVIFFREIPTPLSCVGMILTVAALMLLCLPERRPHGAVIKVVAPGAKKS